MVYEAVESTKIPPVLDCALSVPRTRERVCLSANSTPTPVDAVKSTCPAVSNSGADSDGSESIIEPLADETVMSPLTETTLAIEVVPLADRSIDPLLFSITEADPIDKVPLESTRILPTPFVCIVLDAAKIKLPFGVARSILPSPVIEIFASEFTVIALAFSRLSRRDTLTLVAPTVRSPAFEIL